MTSSANEQTRMSSLEPPIRPYLGLVYLLNHAMDPFSFCPACQNQREIYRPALLPAWNKLWKEDVLRFTPHVVCGALETWYAGTW
jgi:hypothetical protein